MLSNVGWSKIINPMICRMDELKVIFTDWSQSVAFVYPLLNFSINMQRTFTYELC